MQTALSGVSLAETMLGATANNLANALTPGFKASRVVPAAQPYQTLSAGAGPTASSGGRNPVQLGRGVQPAAISIDTSQGTIALDDDPLSLAIEGDALFVLEGPPGERLYTRDGRFSLNADRELVTADGHRVLGRMAGSGQLGPVRIPARMSVQNPDGSVAEMTGFSIDADGAIRGRFTDGRLRDLGSLALARFPNRQGLQQGGDNLLAAGPNSGLAVEVEPGEAGATLVSGATELSNTDIGANLVELTKASILFSASIDVLKTEEDQLAELLGLSRPA